MSLETSSIVIIIEETSLNSYDKLIRGNYYLARKIKYVSILNSSAVSARASGRSRDSNLLKITVCDEINTISI